ncbi:MAG: SET domain-containing protein [Deltaproteobacteria bacterium]|nr:SET domain-containing protein [Deltaproteobacteria bacterium]
MTLDQKVFLNPDLRMPGDPELGFLAPVSTQIFFPLSVKQSSLSEGVGRGVFADVFIRRDSVIAVGGGQVIGNVSRAAKDFTGVLNEAYSIAPLDFDEPTPNWLINHSCDPNVKVVGRLVILALCDIQAGDELTVDYGTIAAGGPPWSMECLCGAPLCRNIITHEDWKIRDLFFSRFDQWPPFIQARGLRHFEDR